MIAQLQRAVGDALAAIATFLPKLGAFLLVLVIGYFIAKALEKGTDAVLERIGFDRWVERGGVNRALSRSKYDASSLLSRVVYYIAALFVLQFAFGVFGPNPVSVLLTAVVAYLPNVFVAGLIIVVGSAIAAAAKDLIDAAMSGVSYGRVVGTISAGAIVAVSIFAALSQLQIAPLIVTGLFYAALAVIAGSAIIAIGGAGIGPLQSVWENAVNRVQAEAPQLMSQTQGAGERMQERAQQRKEQAQQMGMGDERTEAQREEQPIGTGAGTGTVTPEPGPRKRG